MGEEVYSPPVVITATPPLYTPAQVNATGLLCMVAEISSLAYGQTSTAEVSFVLPYVESKYDALLTCFNTPRMALSAGDVTLQRVRTYDASGHETEVSAERVSSVDALTIPDALLNDPYFASSYRQERYDDFPRAHAGLAHLVSWNGAAGSEFVRSAADNCVMLSSEWYTNRRYTIELEYRNPPSPAEDAGLEEIALWIAPLSGSAAPLRGEGEWADEASWDYSIRGHKYGTTCSAEGSTALRNTDVVQPAFSAPDASAQVQDFAFGGAGNAKRTNEGLRSLAEGLCATYSQEKAKLEAGTMSDQLVPGAMWRAFRFDSTALVDWQLIHETNVSLYPRALDGRRPGIPTREHGIGSRCASLKGACDKNSGMLIDVRTTKARRNEKNIPHAQQILALLGHTGGTFDPSFADRRYRSLYTFGLIGEVLRNSAASYVCNQLLLDDAQDDTEPIYIGNDRGGKWPGDISDL